MGQFCKKNFCSKFDIDTLYLGCSPYYKNTNYQNKKIIPGIYVE